MRIPSSHADQARLERRRFLRSLLALGLAAGGLVTYTRSVEPHWLAIEEVTLALPGLPSRLDGSRLAQLSDFHLSKHFGPQQLSAAIAQVSAADAHWLVLTGDYVGGSAAPAAGLVEPLAALDIPIVAVVGNHDHATRLPTVHRYLQAAGARVLINEAVEVAGHLWIAGLDDVWSGRPNLRAALEPIPPQAATVLLVHEPDYFDTVLAADAPVVLQLSGHSHGGQIRLPTLRADAAGYHSYAPILPRLGRRYPIGLRTVNGRSIYTNRGLGGWPFAVRFNCRPELTVFTLRSA